MADQADDEVMATNIEDINAEIQDEASAFDQSLHNLNRIASEAL